MINLIKGTKTYEFIKETLPIRVHHGGAFNIKNSEKLIKTTDCIAGSSKRYEYEHLAPGTINNKVRNRMMEKEKMSKTFTIDRRKEARHDFDSRMEFNLQKRKIKKKELEKKFYNYNFQPKINKKRINIYSSKAPKVTPRVHMKEIREKSYTDQAPPSNAFRKKKNKSNLGKDTHKRKIERSREQITEDFSNLVSERTRPKASTKISNLIGINLESMNYDYSITNNNSFESIQHPLKESEFGYVKDKRSKAHPNEVRKAEDSTTFQYRQPEIKFSGFTKSQAKGNKIQNLKKSNTEAPAKQKVEHEKPSQSVQNYEHDTLVDDVELEDDSIKDLSKKEKLAEVVNVSQSRNGLNLFLNNENGKFVSNNLEQQLNDTESEGFFKLSTNEKKNSMKVNIKGHFS